MSQIVTLPGGDSVEFPDGMSPDEMSKAIASNFPDLAPKKSVFQKARDFFSGPSVDGDIQPPPANSSDTLNNALRKPIDISDEQRQAVVDRHGFSVASSVQRKADDINENPQLISRNEQPSFSAYQQQNRDNLRSRKELSIEAIQKKYKMGRADAEGEFERMVNAGINPNTLPYRDSTVGEYAAKHIGTLLPRTNKWQADYSAMMFDVMRLPGMADEMRRASSQYGKYLAAQYGELGDKPEGFWTRSFIDGIPSALDNLMGMSASIAATVVTRNPAMLVQGMEAFVLTPMFMQKSGGQYEEGRKSGMGVDKAAAYATLKGLSEVIPERLSFGFLESAGTDAAKGMIRSAVTNYMKANVTEVAEEQITAITDYLIDRGMKDPDKPIQDLFDDMVSSGAGVMTTMPLIMGGNAAAIGAVVAAAKLGEKKSPKTFAEYVSYNQGDMTPVNVKSNTPFDYAAVSGVRQPIPAPTIQQAPDITPADIASAPTPQAAAQNIVQMFDQPTGSEHLTDGAIIEHAINVDLPTIDDIEGGNAQAGVLPQWTEQSTSLPEPTLESTPLPLPSNAFGEQKDEVAGAVDVAAHEAATSPLNDIPQPTDAQKEAGNYRKGHLSINGLDISIENPAGSKRTGTAQDGTQWETEMRDHYGYIRGTVGKDKDHIDAFVVGRNPEQSDTVYVVDQIDPKTGQFDEHKIILGMGPGEADGALSRYLANYEPGWKGGAAITEMSLADFRLWLKNGNTKAPVAYRRSSTDGTTATSVAQSIVRGKGGKLGLTGFQEDEVRAAAQGLGLDVHIGSNGAMLVSAPNNGQVSLGVEKTLRTALLGDDVSPAPKRRRRRVSGNLRNDINILSPGLYAEVAKGGDGESSNRDLSLIAEELRSIGYVLPETETGSDAGAVIEMISQDIANGGGTGTTERQIEQANADEAKKKRSEVMRMAREYGIETHRGIVQRRQNEIESELDAAIEHEIGVAGKAAYRLHVLAVESGISEDEIADIDDAIAAKYNGDLSNDMMVRMWRDIAIALEEKINELETGTRETENASVAAQAEGAATKAEFSLEEHGEKELEGKEARASDRQTENKYIAEEIKADSSPAIQQDDSEPIDTGQGILDNPPRDTVPKRTPSSEGVFVSATAFRPENRQKLYAVLAGKQITIDVTVRDSGETHKLELDAEGALRESDGRVTALRELLDCMRG